MNSFQLNDFIAGISIALPLFAIGVTSPGPATLAIMNISMRSGRSQGLAFGLGVCSGSLFWGLLAALGVSAALAANTQFLLVLKVFGAVYFLWLAFKLLRSAWQGRLMQSRIPEQAGHFFRQFIAGLALHLVNPKAMFVWMAVIAIGLSKMQNPNSITAVGVTIVCWSLSVVVFASYALLFSTDRAVAVYQKLAPWIDGVCGMAFALAGVVILLTV